MSFKDLDELITNSGIPYKCTKCGEGIPLDEQAYYHLVATPPIDTVQAFHIRCATPAKESL